MRHWTLTTIGCIAVLASCTGLPTSQEESQVEPSSDTREPDRQKVSPPAAATTLQDPTLSSQPKISYSKETVAQVGEDVLLDCGVEGVDLSGVADFKISWSKIDEKKPANSLPIATGENVVLFSNKYAVLHPSDTYQYSLKIAGVTEEDTGLYRCTVHFGDNQKINADVPLTIPKAPFFVDNLTKTLRVTEGDSISIDCQPGGSPAPSVYWERVNDELPYYGGKLFKSNQFDIPNIERSHNGKYVCHADNGIGVPARSEIILEVQFKPEIFPKRKEIYAKPFETVHLECHIDAYPEANIAWFKEDVAIMGSANFRVKTMHSESTRLTKSTLTIVETRPEDFGAYFCKAENAVGKSEESLSVNLKSPPVIVNLARREIFYDQFKAKARDALPLELECVANGFPTPTYSWRKNGETFNIESDSRFSMAEDSGTLFIANPTFKDNGIYQCFAYNELGTSFSEPILVSNSTSIEFKNVKGGDYEVEGELGRPLKLNCPEVVGYPKPDLKWVKAYNPEEGADQFKLEFVSSDRAVVDPEGGLWFSHITEDDDSFLNKFKYMCLGVTDFQPEDYALGAVVSIKTKDPEEGPKNSETTGINVESFKMYSSPSEQTFVAHENNHLWCIFGGEPSPEIVWRRSDGLPFEESRLKTDNFDRTLVFTDTKMEDAGEYECFAGNGVGEVKSIKMRVDVMEKPRFRTPMEGHVAQEGSVVSLVCDAISSSPLNFEWFFNGHQIRSPPGSNKEAEDNKLTIYGVSLSDIGTYACNASNDLGYTFGQTSLNVIPSTKSNAAPVCTRGESLQQELAILKEFVARLQQTVEHQNAKHEQETLVYLRKIASKLGVDQPETEQAPASSQEPEVLQDSEMAEKQASPLEARPDPMPAEEVAPEGPPIEETPVEEAPTQALSAEPNLEASELDGGATEVAKPVEESDMEEMTPTESAPAKMDESPATIDAPAMDAPAAQMPEKETGMPEDSKNEDAQPEEQKPAEVDVGEPVAEEEEEAMPDAPQAAPEGAFDDSVTQEAEVAEEATENEAEAGQTVPEEGAEGGV